MNPQNLPSCLLPLVLVLASFTSCLSTYEQKLTAGNVPDHTLAGDGSGPSHLRFSAITRKGDGMKGFPSLPNDGTKIDEARLTTVTSSTTTVNVDDFAAKADGSTDDSEAFKKAWKEACSSKQSAVIVVPRDKVYLLKPITFPGPCNSDIVFKIFGTIKASTKTRDYAADTKRWLVFDNVMNIRVRGGGTINGNGKIWWQKSCKIDKTQPCKTAPTAVTFNECKNVIVSNLRIKNAQQMHLTFQKCVNVRALNLRVTSPRKSPNTDGIHVTGTQNIRISNSVIGTGDDCISIVSGSKNVLATSITCGPGHGISIGSLGAGNSEAEVSNVLVDGATLTGTTNGVRIKTWQGGSGYAKSILFQNIVMRNVTNPIIIDQNYCDQQKACTKQSSAVQVSNIVYRNIKGTSASKVATKFDCSQTHPCKGISLQNVDLALEEGGSSKAACDYIELTDIGTVSPKCSN